MPQAQRLLVVATAPVDPQVLRDTVREHAGENANVRIVAPAADVSRLQWLANDEDEARAWVEKRRQQVAEAAA